MARYSVTPNMLVVPPQLLLYLAVAPEEKIVYAANPSICARQACATRQPLTLHALPSCRFNVAGPAGPANFEAGVAGYESRAYRGLGVFSSSPVRTLPVFWCSPTPVLTHPPRVRSTRCRTMPTRCRCCSARRRWANSTACRRRASLTRRRRCRRRTWISSCMTRSRTATCTSRSRMRSTRRACTSCRRRRWRGCSTARRAARSGPSRRPLPTAFRQSAVVASRRRLTAS